MESIHIPSASGRDEPEDSSSQGFQALILLDYLVYSNSEMRTQLLPTLKGTNEELTSKGYKRIVLIARHRFSHRYFEDARCQDSSTLSFEQ